MLWRIALGIGLLALGYVVGKQVGRNERLEDRMPDDLPEPIAAAADPTTPNDEPSDGSSR